MRINPFRAARRAQAAATVSNPLVCELLSWPGTDIPWTIGAGALQGLQCFGSTGSGKSSAILRLICDAYLTAGFGGIFLCSKPDDVAFYMQRIRDAGREQDAVLLGPDHPQGRYNFIASEFQRGDAKAGVVEGLADLLSVLVGMAKRKAGEQSKGSEPFWDNARNEAIRNAVETVALGGEAITIRELLRVVSSAPVSIDEVTSERWQSSSYCHACLVRAERNAATASQRADIEILAEFWLSRWPRLNERTRSVVVSDVCSNLDPLQRGVLRDTFSTDTTVSPEMTHDGKLIIVDAPPMRFPEIGKYVSTIFKHCFQRVQSRRTNPVRPCFLIADESHLHAVPEDAAFATVARSTRTAIVYITQSIASYITAFGGEHAEAEVTTLLGNLQTQIFLQQTDAQHTIPYIQKLIGRRRQFMMNGGTSTQGGHWSASAIGMGGGQSVNGGFSETFECDLQAADLSSLRRGGPPDWCVDGILYCGGQVFPATGTNWMRVTFPQKRP